MKIFIAVPTFENISPDTFKSIYGQNPAGHQLVFDFVRGYDCAVARNEIAKQAIAEGADYVLMVDSDNVLPPNTILHFLEDPKEITLGYCMQRSYNGYSNRTCIYRTCKLDGKPYYNYDTESAYTTAEMNDFRERGVHKIRIRGGGMAIAFIKTDVFRQLPFPWFKFVEYEDGHGILSEDLYFCEKCKDAGIPIYADTRVGCGHIMRYVKWPE